MIKGILKKAASVLTAVTLAAVCGATVMAAPEAAFSSASFGVDMDKAAASFEKSGDTVKIKNDKGSMSLMGDGAAFYYTQIKNGQNFKFSAKVTVDSFDPAVKGADSQSFGIMIRNAVGKDKTTDEADSNMIAATVGGIGSANSFGAIGNMRSNRVFTSFSDNKTESKYEKGSSFTLAVEKSGNIITLSCGDKVIGRSADIAFDKINVGVFNAAVGEVTFSDIKIDTAVASPKSLEITKQPAKTEYFVSEKLDLTGLELALKLSDGTSKPVDIKDCKVSGFDSEKLGSKPVAIEYYGYKATLKLNVVKVQVNKIDIIAQPVKTEYAKGEAVSLAGIALAKTYNNGKIEPLVYNNSPFAQLDSKTNLSASKLDSKTAGEKEITLTYVEDGAKVTAGFKVKVTDLELKSIAVDKKPVKTTYYKGVKQQCDWRGLLVKANYSDSTSAYLPADEYTVDGYVNAGSLGTAKVNVEYNGFKTSFEVNIADEKAKSILIDKLPVTTIMSGDKFDSSGMQVVTFMNSERKLPVKEGSDYTIDTSALGSAAGVYPLKVVPTAGGKAAGLEPVSFNVTVREKKNYEWKPVIFGQSISADGCSVEPAEKGTLNGTIKVSSTGGKGKITGSHDGIAFYYTELDPNKDNFKLTAKIKVIEFAKAVPDGQEGFGIMVRDAINEDGNSTVFPSNMAFVGGFKGLKSNGKDYDGSMELVVRSGVNDPSGAGAKLYPSPAAIIGPRPKNGSTYTLTLEKTNSGFVGKVEGIGEKTVYMTGLMDRLDTEKMYLGFFAARVANIEVTDAKLTVTDVNSDTPKLETPAAAAVPAISLKSLPYTTKSEYELKVTSNVSGYMTVSQEGKGVLARDRYIGKGETVNIACNYEKPGMYKYTAAFVPETNQEISSVSKLAMPFTVEMRSFGSAENPIYAAPNATRDGKGTKEDPVDIYSAVHFVEPGQTIYARGGTYNMPENLDISLANTGTENAVKTLAAYEGETPVFDFGTTAFGMYVDSNYWHIKGIEITKSAKNGLRVGGNNNVIELVKTYVNGDTGMQISRGPGAGDNIAGWPSNNIILNCESYDNRDASENNADGFAAKLTCGEGNKFVGCISHNNIDDGWDLYTKSESGPIGVVTIENCISYSNGVLSNGKVGAGDRNGFKLGGEGIPVAHKLINCISFNNKANGYTNNSNPAIILENCTSYNNGTNLVLVPYKNVQPSFGVSNFVSYNGKDTIIKDNVPDGNKSADNYFFNGEVCANSASKTVTEANFESLTEELPYKRTEKGDIILGSFLKTKGLVKSAAVTADTAEQQKAAPDYALPIAILAAVAILAIATATAYNKRRKNKQQ